VSEEFKGRVFDEYAGQTGGWAYDNGWRYAGEYFGAVYIGGKFGETEADCLLMLREGDQPGRTVILHKHARQLVDIWSGQVQTKPDFDRMMQEVREYAQGYRKG
jgi:hypothetical protein